MYLIPKLRNPSDYAPVQRDSSSPSVTWYAPRIQPLVPMEVLYGDFPNLGPNCLDFGQFPALMHEVEAALALGEEELTPVELDHTYDLYMIVMHVPPARRATKITVEDFERWELRGWVAAAGYDGVLLYRDRTAAEPTEVCVWKLDCTPGVYPRGRAGDASPDTESRA